MKKLKYLCVLMIAFFIMSKSYCQIEKDKSEKNLVDVPDWFSERGKEKIRKIEAMDTLGYHEFIQLSVSYAEIGANSAKVGAMIDSALRLNKVESSKTFNFIIEKQKNWRLSQKYSEIVKEKLRRYDFENF
ncbi:hypothetical protein ACFOUP_13805 [Belliella kenyensis]|uniref:Uncharacterized protein n=1 Tax=Belliella kenyensis TaxID=1472724 RepID=A0ABV8EQC8_9BACT|nr:hypothetical protein [Belliella kenyensis]MCH7401517.1 hypothetical protein [Belliella kenyensis]MDN3603202.1 hypothetical protein [Belliella kenyensis]